MLLSSRFKNRTKDLFYYTGLTNFLIRSLHITGSPRLLVFVYHRICPSTNTHSYLSIQEDVFESHIKFIKNNFKVISLTDGLDRIANNDSRKIYAAINFDDGYMDNYLHAYPILKKHQVPATIFLSTDFIGKGHVFWWDKIFNIVFSSGCDRINFDIDSRQFAFRLNGRVQNEDAADYINKLLMEKDEEEMGRIIEGFRIRQGFEKRIEPSVMLGWGEIKEMAKDNISFGSHGKTHRNLCSLKDEDVHKELIESKKELEKNLSLRVNGFCYPFGIFDKRVKALVKEAGFKYARATLKGANSRGTDMYGIKSIDAGSSWEVRHLASKIALSTSLKI